MIKKAAAVAAMTAGMAMIAAPAFAGVVHHPVGGESHDNLQTGLVNLGNTTALNDVNVLKNVQVPVCIPSLQAAVGLVAVNADALSEKMVKDCGNGVINEVSANHEAG